MVQVMRFGTLPFKLEIEGSFEDENQPLAKRTKSLSATPCNQWSTGRNDYPIAPSHYNPLNEPSPLGLQLRKSPSLLDLIQMNLSQGNALSVTGARSGRLSHGIASSSVAAEPSGNLNLENKKDIRGTAVSGASDKLKASNFPGSVLRIGCWEYVSRYEGDLVAKCYFAKHKLVWEILDRGLKSKIEIQWSDIIDMKANCPDNGPGTLTVVLARPPIFFKETNPQPRKHTLWQATADFTDGQATINRKHFLQCSHGLLNKQYEKLIQCDTHLNSLTQQSEIVLDSPYFKRKASFFEDPNDSNSHAFNQLDTAEESLNSCYKDLALPASAKPSSLGIAECDRLVKAPEHLSKEAPSPSSVMTTHAIEGNGNSEESGCQRLKNCELLKVPGLRPSVSMSDLVNHIGNCISEQMTAGNLTSGKGSECQDMLENISHMLLSDTQFTAASDEKSLMKKVNSLCCLLQDPAAASNVCVNGESQFENIAQILLSDTQFTTASDEKSLMKKVNSLCCLLQDSATASNGQGDGGSHFEEPYKGKGIELSWSGDSMHEHMARSDTMVSDEGFNEVPGCKQAPMSRKDSFGDLLFHLPQITSLPRFLFDISEDHESPAS